MSTPETTPATTLLPDSVYDSWHVPLDPLRLEFWELYEDNPHLFETSVDNVLLDVSETDRQVVEGWMGIAQPDQGPSWEAKPEVRKKAYNPDGKFWHKGKWHRLMRIELLDRVGKKWVGDEMSSGVEPYAEETGDDGLPVWVKQNYASFPDIGCKRRYIDPKDVPVIEKAGGEDDVPFEEATASQDPHTTQIKIGGEDYLFMSAVEVKRLPYLKDRPGEVQLTYRKRFWLGRDIEHMTIELKPGAWGSKGTALGNPRPDEFLQVKRPQGGPFGPGLLTCVKFKAKTVEEFVARFNEALDDNSRVIKGQPVNRHGKDNDSWVGPAVIGGDHMIIHFGDWDEPKRPNTLIRRRNYGAIFADYDEEDNAFSNPRVIATDDVFREAVIAAYPEYEELFREDLYGVFYIKGYRSLGNGYCEISGGFADHTIVTCIMPDPRGAVFRTMGNASLAEAFKG